VFILCISFCVCIIVYVYLYLVVFVVFFLFCSISFSTCWLGLLTCKNRLPYNLYCVGGDVKHCSLTQSDITTYCCNCRVMNKPIIKMTSLHFLQPLLPISFSSLRPNMYKKAKFLHSIFMTALVDPKLGKLSVISSD